MTYGILKTNFEIFKKIAIFEAQLFKTPFLKNLELFLFNVLSLHNKLKSNSVFLFR